MSREGVTSGRDGLLATQTGQGLSGRLLFTVPTKSPGDHPARGDQGFESRSLQRRVRYELDLGEGGVADEIAAAPRGALLAGGHVRSPLEDWPPSLWPNHGPAG